MQEEAALRSALAALKAHNTAMRQLDDSAMPSELIDLVLRLSRIVNDRRAVEGVVEALKSAAESHNATDEETRVATLYRELARTRPDLAQAFSTAAVSAMAAIICRWPHNAILFNPVMIETVREPAEETMRVVRFAKTDWASGRALTAVPVRA